MENHGLEGSEKVELDMGSWFREMAGPDEGTGCAFGGTTKVEVQGSRGSGDPSGCCTSWPHCSLTVGLWASYVTRLTLSFLIHKMGDSSTICLIPLLRG